ncbi:putative ribonuclease H-like domain-containing protein [Tanacetum coccineum]
MLQKETLLDVVGTSGCRYVVLQSFLVERIEQGNEYYQLRKYDEEISDSSSLDGEHDDDVDNDDDDKNVNFTTLNQTSNDRFLSLLCYDDMSSDDVKDEMSVPVTTEEKTNKKNDVKARSLLLMALPNEHQLTFSQYSDAKTMFAAIKIRFRGNEATKKTQKTLLAILGVVIAQEDLNSKFLRSLPPEWNTHVVVWMNKADIETMSIDDLYNNFKIVEQDVKKSVGASSGTQNLAFMTAPSTSSANDVNIANPAFKVSTVSPNINIACPQYLEQIHEDDLEAMDLKWQLSLLSIRVKRYFQRTRKKIFINANDTAGYDKSKVECFNYHKTGHFARECRAPRNKEGQFKYQDNTRKQGNNENTSSKAMLAIDGVAFTYKRGLATVEEQLITYRKNEVLFSEEVAVLKREVACKDYEINVLKSEFEKVKQEKEGIEFKIKKFDNASKSLNKLLENLEFKSYGFEDSKQESNIVCDKKSDDSKENSDDSLVKEQVSEDTSSFVESSLNVDKETVFLVDKKIEFVKPKNHEKPVKKSVRYAEMYRSQSPRGNQRNWNNLKSQQLGSDFVMYNKACFVCGSFDHIQAHCKYHQRERMVYGNNYNRVNYNYTTNRTHPNAQRNMVPRAVLMKTGLKPFNTARTVNTAHPKSIVFSAKPMSRFSKSAQSTVRRPYQSKTVLTNKKFTQEAKAVNTARPKATTKPDSASITLKKHNYIDAQGRSNGCSRHMTRNIAYLSDFKEFDGGYVAFGGGAHAERRNRTLIEVARTMLADSKLPTTFWVEAVSIACYVQNRILVVKPHNKTPYELFRGFKLALSFMRPFGCHVTILNTLDSLGKFDGKSDEGFFVGYSLSSKAFRVYNTRTRRVEENLHIGFLENKPMIERNGPKWLFDINSLTQSMNFVPVTAYTISNESVVTPRCI